MILRKMELYVVGAGDKSWVSPIVAANATSFFTGGVPSCLPRFNIQSILITLSPSSQSCHRLVISAMLVVSLVMASLSTAKSVLLTSMPCVLRYRAQLWLGFTTTLFSFAKRAPIRSNAMLAVAIAMAQSLNAKGVILCLISNVHYCLTRLDITVILILWPWLMFLFLLKMILMSFTVMLVKNWETQTTGFTTVLIVNLVLIWLVWCLNYLEVLHQRDSSSLTTMSTFLVSSQNPLSILLETSCVDLR